MADPTYVDLTVNGNHTVAAGTALAAAQSLADADAELTILAVANSDDDTDLTFTVKAGDYPPAIAAGQGDLAVTVPFGKTVFIGPLESGRFLQSDGSLSFTASPTTGTVIAYRVKRA